MLWPNIKLGNYSEACIGVCFCQGNYRADHIPIFQTALVRKEEQGWFYIWTVIMLSTLEKRRNKYSSPTIRTFANIHRKVENTTEGLRNDWKCNIDKLTAYTARPKSYCYLEVNLSCSPYFLVQPGACFCYEKYFDSEACSLTEVHLVTSHFRLCKI